MNFNTVILSAPQGFGKTTNAREFMAIFHCGCMVDEWTPQSWLTKGALHLTNIHPDELTPQLKGLDFDQFVTLGWRK